MEPLKREFKGRGEVKGFMFECVEEREGVAYLYRVSAEGASNHFEVFRHAENSFLGRVAYPGSNSFGTWAWTFKDEVLARNKFEELCLEKKV